VEVARAEATQAVEVKTIVVLLPQLNPAQYQKPELVSFEAMAEVLRSGLAAGLLFLLNQEENYELHQILRRALQPCLLVMKGTLLHLYKLLFQAAVALCM
jgi:hypothetical protein